MTRLKDVAIINRSALSESTDPDHTFRYLDIGSVDGDGRVGLLEELRFSDAPSRARRLVRPGDTIVSTVRTYLKAIAEIGGDAPNLVVSTGFATLTPRPGVHPRYLTWAIRSNTLIDDVVARSVGVSYPAITATELGTVPVALPSSESQERIAAYLDAETAHLDDLVAELTTMKSLINEQSIEHQASLALGGASPRTEHPRGQSWIRQIPRHWPIARLKYEARLESGHTPSRSNPELWQDCTIPWVSLNDVTAMVAIEFIESTVNLLSEAGLAASSARILPAGTVVLSRDATIGRTAILATPMATSQHFADWICGPNLDPRYLWLLFRTAMQPHFDSLTDGATLRTIGMPDLRQLIVPIPPVDEQLQIVTAAESVRTRERKAQCEVDNQIALLRQRRQALITHAVTHGIEGLPGVA